MEWYLNIPKILHVYWGGGVLHYLRFLTIKTFMRYNPDWTIMFWYPKYPSKNITWYTGEQNYDISKCSDFTNEVMDLPIIKNSVDFEDFGFSNNISEVHKSDYLRLRLLSTFGGLWSDMDIFYFKPMTNLVLNTPENAYIETFYCNREYGHSVGFLMASKENKFFNTLENVAKSEYNPHFYQTMGVMIYNKYFSTEESINKITPAINISMDVVYSHRAGDTLELLNNNPPKFNEESIGIHWFGGDNAWLNFLNKTNGGLDNLGNTIIEKLIKHANLIGI